MCYYLHTQVSSRLNKLLCFSISLHVFKNACWWLCPKAPSSQTVNNPSARPHHSFFKLVHFKSFALTIYLMKNFIDCDVNESPIFYLTNSLQLFTFENCAKSDNVCFLLMHSMLIFILNINSSNSSTTTGSSVLWAEEESRWKTYSVPPANIHPWLDTHETHIAYNATVSLVSYDNEDFLRTKDWRPRLVSRKLPVVRL